MSAWYGVKLAKQLAQCDSAFAGIACDLPAGHAGGHKSAWRKRLKFRKGV